MVYSVSQAVVVNVILVSLRIMSNQNIVHSKLGSDEGAIVGAVLPMAKSPPVGVAVDTLRKAPPFPLPKE